MNRHHSKYQKQCIICNDKCWSSYWNTKYCAKCRDLKNSEINRKYYQTDTFKATVKKWKQANQDKLRIYRHNNMINWQKKRNAKGRKESVELTDLYIRQILVQRSSVLKRGDITPELIQAKRLELQFNRLRKEVKMARPTITKKTPKPKVIRPKKVTVEVYSNDYESIDHMAKAVRSVLKSLTDKDGYYDTKEADTIGNIFGKQVHLMKVKLEAHKIAKGNIKIERKLLGE